MAAMSAPAGLVTVFCSRTQTLILQLGERPIRRRLVALQSIQVCYERITANKQCSLVSSHLQF